MWAEQARLMEKPEQLELRILIGECKTCASRVSLSLKLLIRDDSARTN